MDSLLIKNTLLLSGQNAPFTGEWMNTARFRENLYSFYAEGTGSITLQYQSPFFVDQAIDFYSVAITGASTYASSSFSTSPMVEVRAVSSGSGRFYCASTSQN